VFSGVILEKPGDLDRKMFKDDQELDPVEQTERGRGTRSLAVGDGKAKRKASQSGLEAKKKLRYLASELMEESPVHNNVADLDDVCVNHVTDALDDAGCMCDVPVMAVSEPEPVCSFCSMKLGDDLLIEKTYSMLTGVAFYVYVGLA
jgi:hypothetical protein